MGVLVRVFNLSTEKAEASRSCMFKTSLVSWSYTMKALSKKIKEEDERER